MPRYGNNISISVIRRLPRYLRFLYDLKNNGIVKISSKKLASKMGLTASQIRQDLNCFGEFGQQGYGYNVPDLYNEIRNILGIDSNFKTVSLVTKAMVVSSDTGLDVDNAKWYFRNDSYAPHGVRGQILFADDQIYIKAKSDYMDGEHGLGLLDQNGNLVIAGLAGPFVNGLAPVIQQDNLGKYTGVGYVNMQGEWVVKFELNEF